MVAPIKWTKEQIDDILDLKKQGKSNVAIANIYGVKSESVRHILRKLGMTKSRKPGIDPPSKWTQEEIDLLFKYKREQKSHEEISFLLGKTKSAIASRLLKERKNYNMNLQKINWQFEDVSEQTLKREKGRFVPKIKKPIERFI